MVSLKLVLVAMAPIFSTNISESLPCHIVSDLRAVYIISEAQFLHL